VERVNSYKVRGNFIWRIPHPPVYVPTDVNLDEPWRGSAGGFRPSQELPQLIDTSGQECTSPLDFGELSSIFSRTEDPVSKATSVFQAKR
jgi:hypothetical protein